MEDSDTPTARARIFVNQVDTLYANLGFTTLALALLSTFLAWILWPVATLQTLFAWYGCMLTLAAGGGMLWLLYQRTIIHEFNARFWLGIYMAGILLAGACWGALLPFVVPTTATTHLLATIFILSGVVTGSAATLTGFKPGLAVFAVPAILPGAIYLMFQDASMAFFIGGSLLLFLIFILYIALRIYRTLNSSLRKQVEVGNRLSLLEIEKIELEHKLDRLNHQLQEEQLELEQLRAMLKQRHQPAAPLRRANELNDQRYASLLDDLDGGVWELNMRTGEVVFGNGWLRMLGYDDASPTNRLNFWENILHPDDRLGVLNKLHAFAEGSLSHFTSSHRLKSHSGEWVWVMARAHGIIWGSFGEVLNLVAMELHVPESGDAAARSLGLLNFDFNAWLVSEEAFERRFRQLLKTTSLEGIEHSLYHIRLVRVDDQQAGSDSLDEICLYEVGRALLNEFRHGDALLRQGSDAFALLMAFCRPEDAWDKALALQHSLRRMQADFRGKQLKLTVGIGITPITAASESIDALMQDARSACDHAIATSTNLIHVYQRDNPQLGSSIIGKHLARKIGDGINQNQLKLSVQPLQHLNDDMTGAATSHLVVKACLEQEPAELLDGASLAAAGLGMPFAASFDSHVLGKLLTGLDSGSGVPLTCHYECADASLTDPAFNEVVMQVLASRPAAAFRLCLGISAKALTGQPAHITQFIKLLKSAGGMVAITHFDNSVAVQQLIKECPVDFLKLDAVLLQNLEQDRSTGITLKYINDIIHLAGIQSIIEPADARLRPELLHALQIDFLQLQ